MSTYARLELQDRANAFDAFEDAPGQCSQQQFRRIESIKATGQIGINLDACRLAFDETACGPSRCALTWKLIPIVEILNGGGAIPHF
jgi:hypothetical protein